MFSVQWGVDRTITGHFTSDGAPLKVLDSKAVAAEFVGTFILLSFALGGPIVNGADDPETRLSAAFAACMAVIIVGYSLGHHSGAHLNWAVTFALFLGGQVPWYQGIANAIAQLAASLLVPAFMAMIFTCEQDLTRNLACTIVDPNFGSARALLTEIIGTFTLVYVLWEASVSPMSGCGKNAGLVMGFTVLVLAIWMIPIDGCSLNPNRSLGPAIVSRIRNCDNFVDGGLRDVWIMILGPFLGATFATLVRKPFQPSTDELVTVEMRTKEALAIQRKLEVAPESVELLAEEDKADDRRSTSADEPQARMSSAAIFGKCFGVS